MGSDGLGWLRISARWGRGYPRLTEAGGDWVRGYPRAKAEKVKLTTCPKPTQRRGDRSAESRNQTGTNHRCTQMNTDRKKDRHELHEFSRINKSKAEGTKNLRRIE